MTSRFNHPSEQGHWYDSKGNPVYTIVGANGKERPTTLRDARKMNLFPSVTSIIRCASAPGLERWKQEQVLLAALTLPRLPDEPEEAWLKRVMEDSQEQARKAAERGTAIHAVLQRHFEGVPPEDFTDEAIYVNGVGRKLNEWFGPKKWIAEASFAHPLGFGGKCDLHDDDTVCDFKTKEFTEEDMLGTWDEHAMQLAAYRVGLGMPEARCAIVYVSVNVPGLVHVCELSQNGLDRGWRCFKALLDFWKAKTGYEPSFEK